MSERHTNAVKARRRKQQAAWQRQGAARTHVNGLTEIHTLRQMPALAERGEQLPAAATRTMCCTSCSASLISRSLALLPCQDYEFNLVSTRPG